MTAPFFGVLVACCSAGREGLAIGVGMDEVGADVATEVMLELLCVGLFRLAQAPSCNLCLDDRHRYSDYHIIFLYPYI
jgi:hypothetical protein